MESVFRAYDIRGKYPDEINEDLFYKVGRAFVIHTNAKRVAVGRGERTSSPQLFKSLVEGITDQGCDVIDLGITTTPMVYYASGKLDVDGALSITASHNTAEYNGLKLNHRNAIPIGEGSGLRKIQKLVEENNFQTPEKKGVVTQHNIKDDYIKHFSSFADLGDTHIKAVVDPANGMGIIELPILQNLSKNIDLITIYDKLDMSFPNHEANPIKTETLDELRRTVMKENADVGIAFDGDADRVGFVDEKGDIVPMDYITALLAKEILKNNEGATILYDLRSTNAVKEIIEESGGIAKESRVGHAFIKRRMHEENALFAGELSGHYYFKENFTAESASYAVILLLNLLAKTKKPLSELAKEVKRYAQSGEINRLVSDKKESIDIIKKTYKDGALSELDGIKITYPDWWFSVRASNTEPYLRINIEANTKELLSLKQAELLHIVQGE